MPKAHIKVCEKKKVGGVIDTGRFFTVLNMLVNFIDIIGLERRAERAVMLDVCQEKKRAFLPGTTNIRKKP